MSDPLTLTFFVITENTAGNFAKNSERATQLVETKSPQNPSRKVVCPVYTKSYLDLKNVTFDFGKVDWNLCTHVVIVAESEEG